MSKKYTLLTFKGICMNFLLELRFFILSHPVTSKQPREIVQIHMHHRVHVWMVHICLDTFGYVLIHFKRSLTILVQAHA